jgi:hypothetical protein
MLRVFSGTVELFPGTAIPGAGLAPSGDPVETGLPPIGSAEAGPTAVLTTSVVLLADESGPELRFPPWGNSAVVTLAAAAVATD